MSTHYNTTNVVIVTVGATISAIVALASTVYVSALHIGFNEQVFEVPKDFLLSCLG